jgi:hypothetical protein
VIDGADANGTGVGVSCTVSADTFAGPACAQRVSTAAQPGSAVRESAIINANPNIHFFVFNLFTSSTSDIDNGRRQALSYPRLWNSIPHMRAFCP